MISFKRLMVSATCVLVCSVAGLTGCTASLSNLPEPLEPPITRWQSPEEVIGVAATEQSDWPRQPISLRGATIGILSFKGDPAGAPRATQSVSRLLLERAKTDGFNVVDRELLEKRLIELRSDAEYSALSEDQLIQRAMQAVAADYYLIGSVAEYSSRQQNVPLKMLFGDGELERYGKDHGDYMLKLEELRNEAETEYKEAQMQLQIPGGMALGKLEAAQNRLEEIRAREQNAKSADVLRREVESESKQEFRNIAAVGLTARLVEVTTGEFIWFYDIEQRGFSLAQTVGSVSNQLVRAMLQGDALSLVNPSNE